MKSLIYILPIIFVLFAGCERDLEIPFPPHESKLVLNAYLEADKPIDVYVTRSYGPLEDLKVKDILIDDATVEVFSGSDLLGTLVYVDTMILDSIFFSQDQTIGKYHLEGLIAEEGKSYTIKVAHDKYGSASGSTTIPLAPVLTKAEIIQDVYLFEYAYDGEVYGNGQSRIDFTIDDPTGVNYYDFEVGIDLVDTFTNELYYTQLDVTNNPYVDPEGGFIGDFLPMSDSEFSGQSGKLSQITWLPQEWGPIKDRVPLDIKKIYVEAVSINEEYYDFRRKFDFQWENRGNEFGIIPTESIIIYSNVEGGYGIVTGFNRKRFEF